jgi:hypothetical protein
MRIPKTILLMEIKNQAPERIRLFLHANGKLSERWYNAVVAPGPHEIIYVRDSVSDFERGFRDATNQLFAALMSRVHLSAIDNRDSSRHYSVSENSISEAFKEVAIPADSVSPNEVEKLRDVVVELEARLARLARYEQAANFGDAMFGEKNSG